MLADERVDVVHITTPNHLHYPQVQAALAAGKHVVCEKPLAIDLGARPRELVELAERAGSSTARTSTSASTASASEARARVARRRARARVQRARRLPPGLAAATTPTGTGASSPSRAARCARSPTSARTGSTSSSFVTGRGSTERVRRPRDRSSRSGAAPDRRGRDVRGRRATSSASSAQMTTEDLAHVLLRFEGGARGSARRSRR